VDFFVYKMSKTQQLHQYESPVSFCVLYKDGSSGQVDLKELVRLSGLRQHNNKPFLFKVVYYLAFAVDLMQILLILR
jgi:hypothetical protein